MKFNKHERFSIRKFKVGAASVLLGTFGVMLASNAVDIQDINVVKVAKADGSAIISGSAEETKRKEIINELLAKLEFKWKEVEDNRNKNLLTNEEYDSALKKRESLKENINSELILKNSIDTINSKYDDSVIKFLGEIWAPKTKPLATLDIINAYNIKKIDVSKDKDKLSELERLKLEALSVIQNAKKDQEVNDKKDEYLLKISDLKALTPDEKKLEEEKKNRISELINRLELEWEKIQNKRKSFTTKEYGDALDYKELSEKNIRKFFSEARDKISNDKAYSDGNTLIDNLNIIYGTPKEKPEAIKIITESYNLKKDSLISSPYLSKRIEDLKNEAIIKISEEEFGPNVSDLRDEYKSRIEGLSVSKEDEERFNEEKDKALGKLLSKLEEKWKLIEAKKGLRIAEESADVLYKKNTYLKSLKKEILGASNKVDLTKSIQNHDYIIGDIVGTLSIEEPKFKPKVLEEFLSIYNNKKEELENDFISKPILEKLIIEAKEELERASNEKDVEKVKKEYVDKLSRIEKSENFKALNEVEKYASDKSSIIAESISISKDNKEKALKEILDILTKFKDKVTSGNDIDNLDKLVELAKANIRNVKLRLNLPSISNKIEELIANPEGLDGNFDLEQPLLERLRIDLKFLYKNQGRVLGDGSNFIGLGFLEINSINNKAIIKYYENYVYESISESIIADIKANILGGYNVEIINKLLKDVEKNNRSYVETLDKDYKNFGISHFTLENEKIDSVVKLLSNQIMKWKSLIPKLDTLNEKVKENKNITEEEAKRILGLIKDDPKKPEVAPSTEQPENSPVPVPPKKDTPKDEKSEGETKPKENTPNKPESSNPEVSQPDVNKPEETVPSKPTPEVTPKAPEKEMPKPEKPSGEMKPKENTPNKPEVLNPEVSQPDVNKPGEIKPKQPTPEVMPKSPEKETPKEPEIGQPKPGKPEASKPEMDKAKNEKPKGEGPKGEQLSPKEQGSTSTKQELTKQVGDSVVTVIIEDSRKLDLQAKDVTAENKEFIQSKLNDKSATIKVFDLELLDFDNKSIIKSDKERTVKIVVTEKIANKEVSVYYVDKATGQLVKVPAIVNGNTIIFNTDHFSSYGLVISDKEKSKTTSTAKISNKKLPNTGETTNNILGILGLAATVVISTRRKSLKK